MRALILTALLLGCVTGVAGSDHASAYSTIGGRWEGRTVTYHSAVPKYQWSVRQAVAAWNGTGANIRLVAAPRSRAQIVILPFSACPVAECGGKNGFAINSYKPMNLFARGPMTMRSSRVYVRTSFDRYFAAGLIAHELGHSLGLDHDDRRCAVMTLIPWTSCGAARPLQWRCRIVEPDDIRGLVSIYGGRAKPARTPATCFNVPPPRPVTEVSAAAFAFTRSVFVDVTWKASAQPPLASILVAYGYDACPTSPAGAGTATIPVGQTRAGFELAHDEIRSTRVCFTVWATDSARRISPPATTWLELSPRPGG